MGKKARPVTIPEDEDQAAPSLKKLPRDYYEEELARLSVELVKMHEWVKHAGLKVLVIFEGRDAAG
ncbi:MAG: polyphosphate kinase 2, partial [Thermoleophilia bacterium]